MHLLLYISPQQLSLSSIILEIQQISFFSAVKHVVQSKVQYNETDVMDTTASLCLLTYVMYVTEFLGCVDENFPMAAGSVDHSVKQSTQVRWLPAELQTNVLTVSFQVDI